MTRLAGSWRLSGDPLIGWSGSVEISCRDQADRGGSRNVSSRTLKEPPPGRLPASSRPAVILDLRRALPGASLPGTNARLIYTN